MRGEHLPALDLPIWRACSSSFLPRFRSDAADWDAKDNADPEWRLLMVAGMWFQDLFNFDFDVIGMDPARVGTVEGEISFCAHNSAGWRQVLEHVHTDGFARGVAQNARPTSDLRERNRRAATPGGREARSRVRRTNGSRHVGGCVVDHKSGGTVPASRASEFLTDLPDELEALLEWFDSGTDSAALATDVRAYANGLLTALRSDEAIVPELHADTPRVLGLVLTHHIRNPSHGAGWLNLGLALRRLAAWDCASSRAQRLERAISLLRSLVGFERR